MSGNKVTRDWHVWHGCHCFFERCWPLLLTQSQQHKQRASGLSLRAHHPVAAEKQKAFAADANTAGAVVHRDSAGGFSAGIITATLSGTATTANNLSDAANITTGTISSDRLTGSYDIGITGSVVGSSSTVGVGTVVADNEIIVGTGITLNSAGIRLTGIATIGSTSTIELKTSDLDNSVEVSSNATGKLVNRISGTNASFAWINAGNTEIATLLNNGNLGIGKVDPGHKLHVEGTLNVTGNASFDNQLTVGTLNVSNIITSGTDIVLNNVNINATSGISTFSSISLPSVSIASTSIGIGTTAADYPLDVRGGVAVIEQLGVGIGTTVLDANNNEVTVPVFNTDYSAALQVEGTILSKSVGIGTTNTTFFDDEEEEFSIGLLLYESSLKQVSSEIELESSQFIADGETTLGIGTTAVRCAVDFSDAGQSIIAQGDTYSLVSYMLVPRITTNQRNAMNSSAGTTALQEGMLMWNSELNRFEFWDGTNWNYITSSTFTP